MHQAIQLATCTYAAILKNCIMRYVFQFCLCFVTTLKTFCNLFVICGAKWAYTCMGKLKIDVIRTYIRPKAALGLAAKGHKNPIIFIGYKKICCQVKNLDSIRQLISMIGHRSKKKDNKPYHIIKGCKPNKHSNDKHFFNPPKSYNL